MSINDNETLLPSAEGGGVSTGATGESELVDIPCPQCGESFATVDGGAMRFMRFTDVHCECGFRKDFEWVNPNLRVPVEEIRQKLERQKTLIHSGSIEPRTLGHHIYWGPFVSEQEANSVGNRVPFL